MDNSSSPLDTLRQLKEMLDAGALTPTEFEALKQRLVFHDAATASAPPAAPTEPIVLPPAPTAEPHSPMFEDVAADEPLPAAGPGVPPAPFAAPPAPEIEPVPSYVSDEFPEAAAPPARNPLALVLSIVGLLALLGLVLYLSLNRRPSERISSTSLTPADTLTTAIETGPQAEQLTTPVAAPETIRVAPRIPAQPRRAAVVHDSVAPAAPTAPTPADSAASRQ